MFNFALRRHVKNPRSWWDRWRQWTVATNRIAYWRTRLVSALNMWCLFATFIMCSLGLRMIVCESVEGADGVFVLTSDPTVQCGESPQLWLLHIAGGCLFFGMPLCRWSRWQPRSIPGPFASALGSSSGSFVRAVPGGAVPRSAVGSRSCFPRCSRAMAYCTSQL